MKFRKFFLIFLVNFFLGSMANLLGDSLSKFKKNKTDRGHIEKNNSRNFRELNEYDTYITLYFNEDYIYQSGFLNDYKYDIH